MKLLVFMATFMVAGFIFADDFTCNDFADYEQEGFNEYFVAQMRNPGVSAPVIFINYDKNDIGNFIKIDVIESAFNEVADKNKAFNLLADSYRRFLVKKYSHLVGFTRAEGYLNEKSRPTLSVYLSSLRLNTIKRCEDVIKSGEAGNAFESLMLLWAKPIDVSMIPLLGR